MMTMDDGATEDPTGGGVEATMRLMAYLKDLSAASGSREQVNFKSKVETLCLYLSRTYYTVGVVPAYR
jgi:hypothetical protein